MFCCILSTGPIAFHSGSIGTSTWRGWRGSLGILVETGIPSRKTLIYRTLYGLWIRIDEHWGYSGFCCSGYGVWLPHWLPMFESGWRTIRLSSVPPFYFLYMQFLSWKNTSLIWSLLLQRKCIIRPWKSRLSNQILFEWWLVPWQTNEKNVRGKHSPRSKIYWMKIVSPSVGTLGWPEWLMAVCQILTTREVKWLIFEMTRKRMSLSNMR